MALDHAAAAARLRAAYGQGAIPSLREELDATDADGAYAIQLVNTRHWTSEGRRIVGRKIGLTAEAVQKQLGVNQPDYGVLFEDMLLSNGAALQSKRLLQPKVEAEVAIVLSRDLDGEGATADTIAAATEYTVAALEIVDSRIADWRITFADTVADNGSSAFFVLGDERKRLVGLDLRTCGMALEVNGKVMSHGAGVACLGHPLNAAAWLARELATRGERLRAGDVIMTGALGPMVALTPGDVVAAEIGGLGTVGFQLKAG